MPVVDNADTLAPHIDVYGRQCPCGKALIHVPIAGDIMLVYRERRDVDFT